MMDMNISHYRKAITLVVTALIMAGLRKYAISPEDLAMYGFGVGELAEPIVDALLQWGVPLVMMIAQPDKDATDTLLRNWKWIAVGLAFVALLVALVALVL